MATQGVTVACLLLAAGSSRRMGRDKLGLTLGPGLTVLEQTASMISRVPTAERLLVVRSRSALLFDPAAYGFDSLEIGDEASIGMHRSLKRGLARLGTTADAVMVCLGDQPFVRDEDYRLLLDAYSEGLSHGQDLLYPSRAGQRGNPAVIHRRYFEEIFNEPDGDRGCRYLFERHPENVRAWEAPVGSFFRDLDTPEDYRACLN
jgi:molybdenum cofactor cytidylyltransferase